jgi:hypothetical protein
MSSSRIAERAERLRLLIEGGGTYVRASGEVNDEIVDRLTPTERALVASCDDEDLALCSAIFEFMRELQGSRWFALREVLSVLRPGERPWDAFDRLPDDEAVHFLQMLLLSGWWVPPEWAERNL